MQVVVVVPCFNEARRMAAGTFVPFFQVSGVELLFVDDGSTDATFDVLTAMTQPWGKRAGVLRLEHNVGKAEAVRAGLREALERGAAIVGYYDADGATPAQDMLALLKVLQERGAQMAMASRVALLGRDIERHAYRHYTGRVFATLASLILDLRVYDTQCGAKFLVASEPLRRALTAPFLSRWAFDVELIGRLRQEGLRPTDFIEMPVQAWRDVAGSKLKVSTYPRVLGELARMALRLRR